MTKMWTTLIMLQKQHTNKNFTHLSEKFYKISLKEGVMSSYLTSLGNLLVKWIMWAQKCVFYIPNVGKNLLYVNIKLLRRILIPFKVKILQDDYEE